MIVRNVRIYDCMPADRLRFFVDGPCPHGREKGLVLRFQTRIFRRYGTIFREGFFSVVSDHTAHQVDGARFCERCSAALVLKRIEGHNRPVCPACEFVVYLDPKVAAGVIVTLDDEVVLLKRGIEPGMGKWVFPGGYVDRGEQVEAAAAREAREEVGLDVEIEDLLGVYSYPNVPTVLVVYTGAVVGGELKGNFETLEVRTYSPGRIPWSEVAFRSTVEALSAWIEKYARPERSRSRSLG